MKRLIKKIRKFIYVLVYNFFKKTTVQNEKKVLFLSDTRTVLGGNLLYLYNELLNLDYTLNYILKANISKKRSFIDKFKLPYLIATSKYIILEENYPMISMINLRKGTKVIQSWHGLGAFKLFGFSMIKQNEKVNLNSILHKNYTDAIVSSKHIKQNYAEAFKMKQENIHALGIPRTDVFFNKKYISNKKTEIYKLYPALKNKKVILFAPTFRGGKYNKRYYKQQYINLNKIISKLDNNNIFVIKLHPSIKKKLNIPTKNNGLILDLSDDFRDINDLLFVTDILITDYSSVIFEYSFIRKPIIFYVPDFEEYMNSRGFYYPFEKYTYGPIVKTTDELITAIKEEKFYEEKLNKFIDFFCSACDGKSTTRFIEFFFEKNDKII